jgi:Family of unknown function (DUF5662)
MRHIETVRNYLNAVLVELVKRQEKHDQSKLEAFEVDAYEQATPKLKGLTYGSEEYKACLREIKPAIEHHYAHNRHHPEHFQGGYKDMNLIDLIEMAIDWKSSSLRHADGDIRKSIEINQGRFGYSDELKGFLLNTIDWLEQQPVYHKANES